MIVWIDTGANSAMPRIFRQRGRLSTGLADQEQRREAEEDEEAAGVGDRGDQHRRADAPDRGRTCSIVIGISTPINAASIRFSVIASTMTRPSATSR